MLYMNHNSSLKHNADPSTWFTYTNFLILLWLVDVLLPVVVLVKCHPVVTVLEPPSLLLTASLTQYCMTGWHIVQLLGDVLLPLHDSVAVCSLTVPHIACIPPRQDLSFVLFILTLFYPFPILLRSQNFPILTRFSALM